MDEIQLKTYSLIATDALDLTLWETRIRAVDISDAMLQTTHVENPPSGAVKIMIREVE